MLGLRRLTAEELAARNFLELHDWQRRASPGGDVLSQPVLVLIGDHGGDFELFDQDATRVGSLLMKERGWTSYRYELLDSNGACVLMCRGTFGRFWWGGTFSVCDPGGVEVAALNEMHWHRLHTVRPVTAGTKPLGQLQLPHFPATFVFGGNHGLLADNTGRTVADITTYVGVGDEYLVAMNDDLTGPLRRVALAASMLWDNRMLARRPLRGSLQRPAHGA